MQASSKHPVTCDYKAKHSFLKTEERLIPFFPSMFQYINYCIRHLSNTFRQERINCNTPEFFSSRMQRQMRDKGQTGIIWKMECTSASRTTSEIQEIQGSPQDLSKVLDSKTINKFLNSSPRTMHLKCFHALQIENCRMEKLLC